MNNFEKIKNMTLDEMAEFIAKEEELYNSENPLFSGVDPLGFKQWLQEEVNNE